jgi:hypothetical protein
MIKTINFNSRTDFILKEIQDLHPQRYILIALPFLALHPTTAMISCIGIGAHRCYSLWNAPSSETMTGNKWTEGAFLVSIAVFGHFCPLTKLALSSAVFFWTHVGKLYHANGWYNKSIVLLQIGSQATYVASTYYGTQAFIALSLLSQAFEELTQAYQQYQESKKPEMIASILLASIRLYKANAYIPKEYSIKRIFKTVGRSNVKPSHVKSIEDKIEKILSKRLSSPDLELSRLKSNERIKKSLEKISNRYQKLDIAQEIAIAQSIELREKLKEKYFVINHGQNNSGIIVNILAKKTAELFDLQKYKRFYPLRHNIFFRNTEELDVNQLHKVNYRKYKDQILCGDIYLESTFPYESAIYFFEGSAKNVAANDENFTKNIISKILQKYISDIELAEKTTKELDDLGRSLQGGTLYSICIPKEKFHQIGSIVYVGLNGIPFDKASLNDLDLWQDGSCKFFTDITYKVKPQVRLLTSKLTPENGVFIIPHSNLSTEKLSEVEDKVEKLLKDTQICNGKKVDISMTPIVSDLVQEKSLESENNHSKYQIKLNEKIQYLPFDSELFTTKSDAENQASIARIIQSIALPLYKEPLPQSSKGTNDNQFTELARWSHGGLHSARVALWTQVLMRLYETVGRKTVDNPIFLATAGAFHDVAREDEGPDYWDAQSAKALESLLARVNIDPATRNIYTEAIRDKDPEWSAPHKIGPLAC